MRPTTVTFGLLASIALAAFLWQRQTQARLRDELNALHESSSAAVRLQPRLTEIQPHADELAQLRRDQRELTELRRELANLKNQRSAASATAEPSASDRKPLLPGMTPVENFTNVGNATPAAAFQTYFWLIAQADVSALSKMLVLENPATREKADALMAAMDGKSREELGSAEALIALYLTAIHGRLSGVQMIEQSMRDPDVAICIAMVQTRSGQLSKQEFNPRRSDDGWRIVVHDDLVDFVANELRREATPK